MSEKESDIRLGVYAFVVTFMSMNWLGWWKGLIASILIVILVNVFAVAYSFLQTHKHNG